MKREEYIDKVKAKLDEISPFEEPNSFIAAGGDADYDRVKPVISYIDTELDSATEFCLQMLPLSLLANDVDEDTATAMVDWNGVGHVSGMYDYYRLTRLSHPKFERDVTAFISSASPMYLLQQNKYARGGYAKPVVAYVPEKAELEIFSFLPADSNKSTRVKLYYIECNKKAETVMSHIEDYIVLQCAIRVLRVLGDDNAATRLTNEFNEVVTPIMV